jgi:hypothetical protein
MGELIQFPIPDGEATPDGDLVMQAYPSECGGKMHVFVVVPGRCQCGQELWGADGLEAPLDDEAIGIHYVA